MHRKSSIQVINTIRNHDLKEEHAQGHWKNRALSSRSRWLIILGVLIFVAALGGGYAYAQSMAIADASIANVIEPVLAVLGLLGSLLILRVAAGCRLPERLFPWYGCSSRNTRW